MEEKITGVKQEMSSDNIIDKEKEQNKPAIAKNSEQSASLVEPDMVSKGMKEAMKKQIEGSGDTKKLAKDLTYMKSASELQHDEEFKEKYNKELGNQFIDDLKADGEKAAIIDAAKKQEARNVRNRAFYDGCRPIFSLLGIEEAYGLVPMIITVVLLMVPFLIVSLVRFAINSVNSVFVAISGFKKPAFWICTILICLLITVVIVISGLGLIDKLFGTEILSHMPKAA